MKYYVFICEDAENTLEKRKAVRPAHLERLSALNAENRLLTAGPLQNRDGENPFLTGIYGSLIVAKFPSLDDAKAWIAADPFVTAEVYQRVTVKPYVTVFPS